MATATLTRPVAVPRDRVIRLTTTASAWPVYCSRSDLAATLSRMAQPGHTITVAVAIAPGRYETVREVTS